MTRGLTAAALTLLTGGCGADAAPDPAAWSVTVQAGSLDSDALFQAVSPVDSVVWLSGHQGSFARTLDGGESWSVGVVAGAETLQFRDVEAFDASTAVLMSAGEGALSGLFRTEDGGASWIRTFVMDAPEGFLDCMAFWDRDRGLVYGDAVGGELYLLRTDDGGRSWWRVDPAGLPEAQEGEGGFAASGSCVATGPGGEAWIVTGDAQRARVLHTADGGDSWSVGDLPLVGGTGAGATTVGMADDGRGFALGGVIGEGEGERVALTEDSGASWTSGGQLALDGAVYGAASAPGPHPRPLFAVGPGGIDWSRDGGRTWERVDTLTYWAVAFADLDVAWAVGPGGRLARIEVVGR